MEIIKITMRDNNKYPDLWYVEFYRERRREEARGSERKEESEYYNKVLEEKYDKSI